MSRLSHLASVRRPQVASRSSTLLFSWVAMTIFLTLSSASQTLRPPPMMSKRWKCSGGWQGPRSRSLPMIPPCSWEMASSLLNMFSVNVQTWLAQPKGETTLPSALVLYLITLAANRRSGAAYHSDLVAASQTGQFLASTPSVSMVDTSPRQIGRDTNSYTQSAYSDWSLRFLISF